MSILMKWGGPVAGQADVLVHNGRIDPSASGGPVVEAMAIRDGKVLALGEQADALAGPGTRRVDLEGCYVMPGLLDVHNHHSVAGQADLFELEIPPTAGLDELLDAVAQWAQELPPKAWVIGGSWGSGLLPELHDRAALERLDRACGGRPVMLRDDSKHNRWASSAAMALAGIGAHTPDPEGGQILRDVHGEPTGVLIEAGGLLIERVLARVQPTTRDDLARASERGIEILHSYGITGFQDAAASLQLMQALKYLDDQERLKAWVVSSMQVNDFIFGTDPLGEGIIAGREACRSRHHRPDFVKIFLDGVPPTRSAAFLEPYLPDDAFPPCHRGHTTMAPDELEGWLLSTAVRGISAKIHCTGDASVRLVLDAVAAVRAAGHTRPRYHVAHGQFVHPDDIPRFARLGVDADISPALWFPGVIPEAIATVLPPERARRMQPNRDLLDAGAVVAGGSDWPVSVSPNAWEGIYGLVTRQDPTGQFPGRLWPEQAITLPEALAVYTSGCATAMGIDDVAGSLDVGKSADFIVLDDSPYELDLDEVRNVTAHHTWFAGEQVYSRS